MLVKINRKLIPVRVLIDSGCDFSLVGKTWVEQNNLPCLVMDLPTRMTSFNGGQLLHKKVVVNIKINEFYLNWSFIISDSVIFNLANVVLILGKDAFGQNKPLGLHLHHSEPPYLSFNSDLQVFSKIQEELQVPEIEEELTILSERDTYGGQGVRPSFYTSLGRGRGSATVSESVQRKHITEAVALPVREVPDNVDKQAAADSTEEGKTGVRKL